MAKLLRTTEAAKLMGVSNAGMRSLARFARMRGIELLAPQEKWPDLRTPVYDEKKLIHYRDVQRPQRLWPIPVDEQKTYRTKKTVSEDAGKVGSKAKTKATAK